LRIMVTGAAGFIGHHIVEVLSEQGYSVVGVDTFIRSSPRAYRILEELDVKVHRVDVRNTWELAGLMKNVDAVVHAAALVSVEESFERPELYMDVNATGVASVSRAAMVRGVERIVYLSSAAVYGDPVKLPIREDHPLNPISIYGVSKTAGEMVLKSMAAKGGYNYVILRLFNVYGPGQERSPYAGVLTVFAKRALRGEPLIIYGDGEQTRDFIYVGDVADAVVKALETDNVNETYNIGSGVETRIKDLAELVIKAVGMDIGVEHAPPRKGDIRRSVAEISKSRLMLGYNPSIRLEDGVKRLINELKNTVP